MTEEVQVLMDVNPDDFTLPRWTIEKETGLFCNNVTGEKTERLVGVVLRVSPTRIYWGDFKGAETEVLCSSSNGLTPDSETPFGTTTNSGSKVCKGCIMSAWNGETPPPCGYTFNYVISQQGQDIPSVLSLSRSRASVARRLNTFIRFSGVKKWIEFHTEKTQSPKGDFWQLGFVAGEENEIATTHYSQILDIADVAISSLPEPSEKNIDHETGEVL